MTFIQRLRSLGYKHLGEYLQSKRWNDFVQKYKSERSWQCGICGETEYCRLTHTTYQRVGTEKLDDVIPLCTKHRGQARKYIRNKSRPHIGIQRRDQHRKAWADSGSVCPKCGMGKKPGYDYCGKCAEVAKRV